MTCLRSIARCEGRAEARGFTIVEMLVVVAIIITIISILIVALNQAGSSARVANTTFRMNQVSQALVQFKEAIGYYPPLLDEDRNLFDPWGVDRVPGTGDEPDLQDWRSMTTLAEYLIGYGGETADGYGNEDTGDVPFVGIRHPGPDGVWGSVSNPAGGGPPLGALQFRNPDISGERYGPFLELRDEGLVGSVDDAGNVWLPEDNNYDEADPKVLLDFWGEPLWLYRRVYAPGSIKTDYRSFDQNEPTPNLADIFALRPYTFRTGTDIDRTNSPDADGDTSISFELQSADFAIFSRGPDKAADRSRRFDANGFNADNLVELGP